jgi:DNA-binding MarR family transcriptional regulator
VLTEDLIRKFNKSKSRISQALSFLTGKGYIERNYVNNLNNQGSRHKISLTTKGLEIAGAILAEGLDPLEKKVIEELKNAKNDQK